MLWIDFLKQLHFYPHSLNCLLLNWTLISLLKLPGFHLIIESEPHTQWHQSTYCVISEKFIVIFGNWFQHDSYCGHTLVVLWGKILSQWDNIGNIHVFLVQIKFELEAFTECILFSMASLVYLVSVNNIDFLVGKII